MENENKKSVLELLLAAKDAPPAKKLVKMKRISKLAGGNVVLELRALTYAEVLEIKRAAPDLGVGIMEAGVVSPNLADLDLMEQCKGAATRADVIKSLFLPGEIEDIAREIERLSGYRVDVLEEFKKNL